MTQIVLNIEDTSILPKIKEFITSLNGVSIFENNNLSSHVMTKDQRKKLKVIEQLREKPLDPSLINMDDDKTRYIMTK